MRLIDADALLEEIKSHSMILSGLRVGKDALSSYAIEYRKSILRIIDEQPTVTSSEKPDNWIPVSEQLPDLGVLVLVTTSKGEVAENLLERPDTWFYDYGAIAWMPEPGPYKGGTT